MIILTGQLIEDEILKIVDQLNVSLSFTSGWINTVDSELIDQCIWTNNTKECDLVVLILREIWKIVPFYSNFLLVIHDIHNSVIFSKETHE